MFTDLVFNGGQAAVQGVTNSPQFSRVMEGVRHELGMLRPYLVTIGGRNVPCVTINSGRLLTDPKTGNVFPEKVEVSLEQLAQRQFYSPVANDTSLRKEEWIQLDRTVTTVERRELRVWADAMARVPFGGFNGMGKTVMQYEAMSDPGRAQQTMELHELPTNDMPVFSLRSHPLPITMSGYTVGSRKLAESRTSGTPIDQTMPEACTQRVNELVEDKVLGTVTGVTYGGVSTGPTAITGTSAETGFTNFSQRNTKTNFTAPSGAGWDPNTTFNEFLAALETLRGDNHRGPFFVYHSRDWSQYLDRVFSVAGGNHQGETLRTMLRKIDGIEDVVRADRLDSTFTFVFVSYKRSVVEAVEGMPSTIFQWQTVGGHQLHFVVACIRILRLKYDYLGQTGILHGTTA